MGVSMYHSDNACLVTGYTCNVYYVFFNVIGSGFSLVYELIIASERNNS